MVRGVRTSGGSPLLAHIEVTDCVCQGWSQLVCSPRVVERSSAVVEKLRGAGRALDAHWLGRLEPLGQSDKEIEVLADRGSVDRIGTTSRVALLASRLLVAGREGVGDAAVYVVAENLQPKRLERCRHRADLGEDVDAVALVLDHPLDPAHLPLDPVQALDQGVLVGDIAVARALGLAHAGSPWSCGCGTDVLAVSPCSRRLWKRRSLRLFETTKRLEKAMAAAATIGFSRPATASGIA